MVFSSIPAYLDPANWQQQPNNHQTSGSGLPINSPQVLPSPAQPAQPPLPPPPPHPQPHVGGSTSVGSIRPGSMADRARLANIPLPETALKCPRCESTNTKFCYFNNYSLSQPRHFCKTCRRYWTRGGALRNVPVGGGCRRNKRSKASNTTSSKSPANSSNSQNTSTSSTSTVSSAASLLGLTSQIPPLRFMSPLGQLADHYTASGSGEISLNYSAISAPMVGTSEMMNFPMGNGLLGGGISLFQAQQFPLLGGLDPSLQGGSLYHFQGGIEPSSFVGETSTQMMMRPKLSASLLSTQLASVKVEDNPELNLSRQFLGIQGTDQWNNTTANNAWTDLSSFSSSSTSNPL